VRPVDEDARATISPIGCVGLRDVSAMVPNRNGEDLPASVCLPSVTTETHFDVSVTVFDDGSQDGSVEFLVSEQTDVNAAEIGHESGFAVAMYHGIESATRSSSPLSTRTASTNHPGSRSRVCRSSELQDAFLCLQESSTSTPEATG
jgi:hypothetical protein